MLNEIILRIPTDYRHGYKQSILAVAATGLGLVFSSVHELNGTLPSVILRFWPVLLTVFCTVFSFSTLFGHFIFNHTIYHTKQLKALLVITPVLVSFLNYIVLLPYAVSNNARISFLIVLLAYASVYATANQLLLMPNLLQPKAKNATPESMRYVLIIPTVMVTMLSILFGALIPLLLEGYWLSIVLFFLMVIYLYSWFITRNTNRPKYANFHMTILILVSASGAIFYFFNYVFAVLKNPQITMPLKAFYLSIYIGLYLSIPEGYGYTWKQKDQCTEENLENRLKTLGLLLCIYNPFVFLSFLGLSFSTWYIILYALGSVALIIYVQKPRPSHPTFWRLLFIFVSIGFLTLEFGNTLPPIAYYLPKPDTVYLGVVMIIVESTFAIIYTNKEKQRASKFAIQEIPAKNRASTIDATGYIRILDYSVNLRNLRRIIIIFMQICLIVWSGLSEYTAKIQVTLIASTLSFLTELFCDHLRATFVSVKQPTLIM